MIQWYVKAYEGGVWQNPSTLRYFITICLLKIYLMSVTYYSFSLMLFDIQSASKQHDQAAFTAWLGARSHVAVWHHLPITPGLCWLTDSCLAFPWSRFASHSKSIAFQQWPYFPCDHRGCLAFTVVCWWEVGPTAGGYWFSGEILFAYFRQEGQRSKSQKARALCFLMTGADRVSLALFRWIVVPWLESRLRTHCASPMCISEM